MKIAVVGSYGVGLTMRVPRMPVAGETLSGGTFASGHGGKGSNQAVAAARLGARVSLLTAVGRDRFGADARRLWADEGVDASGVRDTDAATMVGVILVDQEGENRIVIAPGALDELTPADVDAFAGRIAEADMVVVSLEIPLPVAVAALRVAREHGVPTLLNPAPAAPLPDEAWAWIDVLTPNASEARVLTGLAPNEPATPDQLAALLRARFAGTIVLTLGAEGALVDRDGVLRDGMLRDGMFRDGKLRDGKLRDGMHRDGMLRDGKLRDGMHRDGMLRDGKRGSGKRRGGTAASGLTSPSSTMWCARTGRRRRRTRRFYPGGWLPQSGAAP